MADTTDKVAIFLDIESLSGWLKLNGGEMLLNRANELGRVVVRRAYGDFSHTSVHSRQNQLNALGFEFVHVFHPVKGKNSADIQIVVDVMESLIRFPDIEWFVLATGDSDFSPLFRRLRELGKSVLGVGPRSALSEAVKKSCNQFIYTEQSTMQAKPNSAASAATASTETNPSSAQTASTSSKSASEQAAVKLLAQVLHQFPAGTTLSSIKNAMRARDARFNEKQLGFNQFSKFLKSAPEIVTLYQVNNTWHAKAATWLKSQEDVAPVSEATKPPTEPTSQPEPTSQLYQQLLRKKGWRSFEPDFLWNVLIKLQHYFPQGFTRSEEFAFLLKAFSPDRSRSDLQSAIYMLYKAGFTVPQQRDLNRESEPILVVQLPTSIQKLSSTIDILVLKHLIQLCKAQSIPLVPKLVSPLLTNPYTEQQMMTLVAKLQTIATTGHD